MRDQILSGDLVLPMQDNFRSLIGTKDTEATAKLFRALWHSYLLNKGSVNLTYWAEQFQCVKGFNTALKILSDNKWIESHSIPARNWAEASINEDKLLQFVTPDELAHVRASKKFAKYMPELLESKIDNLTKVNGHIRQTGLVRKGLKASAGSSFSYATKYLEKYKDLIITNTIKGMTKVRELYPEMQSDEASYDAVSTAIVEELLHNPNSYSMGNNFSDSRGRAIKEGLSKVANPIGYKDFRALLVIPEEHRNVATEDGLTAIYLFIAELHGFKNGTVLDKELFGIICYQESRLPELCADELHERIWLERIYEDLDNFYAALEAGRPYRWTVPIEADASASMLSHLGLLLGDARLLGMTNTIDTGTLSDPWHFNGINRTMFKHAATPMLYGSSKHCYELWQDKGHKYTAEHIKLFNQELQNGALGLANDFKEFIIRWVKPQANMTVTVYEDTFDIECNRFKNVGEIAVKYDIYDTIENTVRRIVHTKTKKVPDLEQFRRWFVTGLI